MTAAEAHRAILRGERVRAYVGANEDENVLELFARDGMVISVCTAGWAMGTVEPVCALDSDYLRSSLDAKHKLERAEYPWADAIYRIGERHQYEECDGILLDAVTAGALRAVDQALSGPNRERFRSMHLTRAVNIAWKLVK